jgi:putative membrane protein
MSLLSLFDPWEPSFSFVAAFLTTVVLFVRGSRRIHINLPRRAAFWVGLALF